MGGASIDECMGPLWQPLIWKELNDIQHLNKTNCYAYMLNIASIGEEKLQPGDSSTGKFENYTCNDIKQRMIDDNPKIMEIDSIDTPIDNDYYKIALVLDEDPNDNDYHFYRQDCNGIWSHKLGTNDITNKDSSGDKIHNPKIANRNYTDKDNLDGHHYNQFCGYFKVPNRTEVIII